MNTEITAAQKVYETERVKTHTATGRIAEAARDPAETRL
jgi:hypothetical protein